MTLDAFDGHSYLNIETYRKSGVGVKTPVWFVRKGDVLHVWTLADSGKAKRIRRDGRVRIAPCTARGDLLGPWMGALAEADATPEALDHLRRLMIGKYGLAFRGFLLTMKLRGTSVTTLRVRTVGQGA